MIKRISNFLVKYHIIIWICLLMMVYCYLTTNIMGFLFFGLFLAYYVSEWERRTHNLSYTQSQKEDSLEVEGK